MAKRFNGVVNIDVRDSVPDWTPFREGPAPEGAPNDHYSTGWATAFSTPFKMFKRYTYQGGVCDPLVISWPAGIKAKGEVRHQYHHATDIVPTLLECCGMEFPDAVLGLHAIAVAGSLDEVQLRRRQCADPQADGLARTVVGKTRLVCFAAQHLAAASSLFRSIDLKRTRRVGAVRRASCAIKQERTST